MNRDQLTRRLVMGLLFGVSVLIGIVLIGDLRQIGEEFAGFRWTLLPWILLCTLFNYGLRFIKWHLYLKQIGAGALSVRESLRLFVAGFPLAVTPGKIGEALKGLWVHDFTGVPTARGISVVVAERISDGIAVLLLSVLGVIAYPDFWLVFLIVLTGLLALIVVTQIRPLALWFLDLGERLPLINKVMPQVREFYEGSFMVFKPGMTLLAVAIGTLSWFGEGVGLYLVLLGLGIPPDLETFAISVFVLAFSTVVGAISTLPGGLGATEASIGGLLELTLNPGTGVTACSNVDHPNGNLMVRRGARVDHLGIFERFNRYSSE